MSFTELCKPIFVQSINDYHKTDNVDTPINNQYEVKSIEYYLYLKNWIDTVQWHFEDIIRDPQIDPVEALALKRRINKSHQHKYRERCKNQTDISRRSCRLPECYRLLLLQYKKSSKRGRIRIPT